MPRTFDIYPAGMFGDPCITYSMRHLYLERAFYYRHAMDDACDPVGQSCTLVDEEPDDIATLDKERVDDAVAIRWGFPQWQLASLSDPLLPPGQYGIMYRACFEALTGLQNVGSDRCSNWVDTGRHFVGVTANDFTEAPPVKPDIRTYPEAFVHYTYRGR